MTLITLAQSTNGLDSMNAINQNFTYLASIITAPTTGSGAPVGTPTGVGLFYVDTTNKNVYVSVGTASSDDWKIIAVI